VISYQPEGRGDGLYVVSYQSLKEDYNRYVAMSDAEFRANLIKILHFACITCWFKELQTQWLLGDTGLIHELVHLLEGFYQGNDKHFQEIRDLFKRDCELV